jgi:hypothetical protein
MFDRPAAALEGILDALQRNERINPADGPQGDCRPGAGDAFDSPSVNGPPVRRRAGAGLEARAVPFGPLTRIRKKVRAV